MPTGQCIGPCHHTYRASPNNINTLRNVIIDNKLNDNLSKNNNLGKIIKPTEDELKLHHNYLKSSLKKIYYN